MVFFPCNIHLKIKHCKSCKIISPFLFRMNVPWNTKCMKTFVQSELPVVIFQQLNVNQSKCQSVSPLAIHKSCVYNFLRVLSLNTLTVQSCRILNFSLVYLSLCTDAHSPKGNMRGIRPLSLIIMFLFDKLSSNKTISVLQYLIWHMETAKESNLCM